MPSIHSFLRAHGLKPNPHWGQHFLVDASVVRAMIKVAELTQSDTVVEIGAGIGVLTKALLEHAHAVTAIELDRTWIPLLQEYIGPEAMAENRLTIVQGNALKVPYPMHPYKIVANIPYHITSHLFKHVFLQLPVRPQSLTLLVQREVGDKICAGVRGEGRSILTILVELFGTPRFVRAVPPGAFLPPPKVESAIVHVECFTEPLAKGKTLDVLLQQISIAFGRKRKMLRASLGRFHGTMELLEAASISPERRPETVSTQEWVALAQATVDRRR